MVMFLKERGHCAAAQDSVIFIIYSLLYLQGGTSYVLFECEDRLDVVDDEVIFCSVCA